MNRLERMLTREQNVGKVVLDVLKSYDYRTVSKGNLKRILENGGIGSREARQVVGLTNPHSRTIYVRNDLRFDDYEQTQAHEFVHAYLFGLGIEEHDEGLVEAIASDWRERLYVR